MNPYDVLGASPDADFATLRDNYRRLVRENHPDLAPTAGARATATARMSAINHAWAIVRDPQRRAACDALLRAQNLGASSTKPPTHVSSTASRRAETSAAKRGNARARSGSGWIAGARRIKRRGGAQSPGRRAAHQVAEAARLYYEHRRTGEAIALCQGVLRVDFRNVAARELLGDIYARQNEPRRAIALWEQALMLAPDNPVLQRKLLALRTSNETPRAERDFEPGREPLSTNPASRVQPDSSPMFNGPSSSVSRGFGHVPKTSLWARVIGRLAGR